MLENMFASNYAGAIRSFTDAIRAHRRLPPHLRVARLNVPYASEIATLVINLPCEGIKTVLKHLISRDVGQGHELNELNLDVLQTADAPGFDDAGVDSRGL